MSWHARGRQWATCLIALSAYWGGPTSAADVGISVSISQPGVYGRVDIGRFPSPVVIRTAPLVIRTAPIVIEPIYMWVPLRHRNNWGRYCQQYNACNTPVYFVRDDWYRSRVQGRSSDDAPGHGRHRGHGHGHGHGRGHDR